MTGHLREAAKKYGEEVQAEILRRGTKRALASLEHLGAGPEETPRPENS